MGMFDSVYAPCPDCGEPVEFQSKSGPCQLKNYRAESVPAVVAEGCNGDESRCTKCDTHLKLKALSKPARVQMQAVRVYSLEIEEGIHFEDDDE